MNRIKNLEFRIQNYFFIIISFLILHSAFIIPVYAGHEIGTEGKYCDGSEIWLDLADGSHQYSDTDCALSGQVCVDAACEDPPPPPPPTTPPSGAAGPQPDEVAVENLNQGTLPSEIIQQVKPLEKNIFQLLADFFMKLLGFNPTFPEIFHPRSDTAQNVQIPLEVKPTSKKSNELLPEFLGGDSGIYSISVPKEINQEAKNTRDFETSFEKGNFPEGITPITGQ